MKYSSFRFSILVALCCIQLTGCRLPQAFLTYREKPPYPTKNVESLTAEAEKAAANQKWHTALTRYEQALMLKPDDEKLQAAFEQTRSQRDIHITKLQNRLYLLQATVLSDEINLLEEMAEADPSNLHIRQQLKSAKANQGELYYFLLQCADNAVALKRSQRGLECLQLASKLPYHTADEERITSLKKQLAKIAAQEQQEALAARAPVKPLHAELLAEQAEQRQQENQQNKNAANNIKQLSKLQERFSLALQRQDFLLAQSLFSQIEKIASNDPDLKKQRKALKQQTQYYVQAQTQKGIELYSTGYPEQALATWKPLLQLTPKNQELHNHIDRAKRFLKKLNQLQKDNHDDIATH
ncbi:hypothetical protein [Zooshikella harenae]|uniref:Tetratricopeptide repeat protein n=1 Tax=Zooshikella harenae TaxID=2827238 RepID=A0ABS5ZB47_9GAMM|nr:hypothetical protein [Zooshikella harenae]MBU2711289.1 hypothetical protein [Zooshikella harenae]